MPVSYPVVNGIRFDFSSIQFRVNGKVFPGIKSLSFNHAMEPGLVRGTAAQVIGRTRGQYNSEGSVELYREDADDFLTIIAPNSFVTGGQNGTGFMEVQFDVGVTYFEPIQGLTPAAQMDIMKGCRIKKEDISNASGSDPSTIKYDFHIMYLIRNGRAPISASGSLTTRS